MNLKFFTIIDNKKYVSFANPLYLSTNIFLSFSYYFPITFE